MKSGLSLEPHKTNLLSRFYITWQIYVHFCSVCQVISTKWSHWEQPCHIYFFSKYETKNLENSAIGTRPCTVSAVTTYHQQRSFVFMAYSCQFLYFIMQRSIQLFYEIADVSIFPPEQKQLADNYNFSTRSRTLRLGDFYCLPPLAEAVYKRAV